MNTYKVIVNCSNCGNTHTIEVPMGTLVTEMDCPTCGCKTVSRDSRRVERNYPECWMKVDKSLDFYDR
jgi:predicted RNA-binding Zn-ribbon protein involved in translation (DUF1610 family)